MSWFILSSVLFLNFSRACVASERAEERPGCHEEHPGALQPVPHRQDSDVGQDQESQQRHHGSRYTGARRVFLEEHSEVGTLKCL